MKVIFHDNFYSVYTGDPAAAEGRMEAVMAVIESRPEVDIIEAMPASRADIRLAHSEAHIARVERQGLYAIAGLAAGGAIQAATLGLDAPAFGLIRPPGHHASADSSWGFCYFNNMAVALERLRSDGKINSAYVLDIDLHFGDGTVNILRDMGYVTIHNCASRSREAYMDEVAKEMEGCSADLIGISAGFDNHVEDWGGTLTTADYYEIGKTVRAASVRSGGGCFGILEGGYNHQVLGENVWALLKGLGG